ncbi:MAG TPA: energy transducer TonB [Terriglobia bacterium]|nr:energy transducer TonB [Terriglobia bacterium]
MAIRTLACLLLAAGMAAAAQQRQSKPLTKEQVVAIVRDGLADESGGRLVKDRGLDFAPAQEFVESLRKEGADDAFVKAVLEAPHPTGALHPERALNRAQVMALIKAGIPSSRVAILASERGIDFEPSDDYLQQLRTAGAGQDALDALKTADRVKPPLAHPPQPDSQKGTRQTSTKVQRIRVSGQVAAAKLIHQEAPEYPSLAKTARIQGTVQMEVVIDKDGTVEDIKVLSGHPLLIESALEAVSRWRYQPTYLNGKPVEVMTEVEINFKLTE